MNKVKLVSAWSHSVKGPGPLREEGVSIYHLYVPVHLVPRGLPTDANPREANTKSAVAKKVRASLIDVDTIGQFHLKHRGITVVANGVKVASRAHGEFDEVTLWFDPDSDSGVVDGNHSYQIILEEISTAVEAGEPLPVDQYVRFEIITGLGPQHVTAIAAGRNTSQQVKDSSLLDLDGNFEPIRKALGADLSSRITWHENDGYDDDSDTTEKVIDVGSVIALLSCFDIERYPESSTLHPVDAYRRKASMLSRFADDPTPVLRVLPLASDILAMMNLVALDAPNHWNGIDGNGSFGALELAQIIRPTRRQASMEERFPFVVDRFGELPPTNAEKSVEKRKGKNGKKVTQTFPCRLPEPAVTPIVGALRSLVVEDPDGDLIKSPKTDKQYRTLKWRTGSSEQVQEIWRAAAPSILAAVYQSWHSQKGGDAIHMMGRDITLWSAAHSAVEGAFTKAELARFKIELEAALK